MAEVRELRILVHNPAVLSRYLPETVVHHLLEAGDAPSLDIDLGAHVVRLRNLLQRIETYVPEYAGTHRGMLLGARPGYTSRVQGTLLAADLSGFTAFSAQLATLGSEGAELVAHTINALFSALLDTLADWDGNLLKLSGDALTVLFSGPEHAHRAVTAALELQKRMDAFQSIDTPAGVFTLRIRIGLASGDVLLAEVGSAERVELLVAGATARQVIELQQHAMPGAVVVADSTYQEIAPICQAVTLAAGLYQVLSLQASPPFQPAAGYSWRSRGDPAWELQALISRIEALRPYLIHQHVDRMADGPPALAGEGDLRPVTALFACLSDASAQLEQASTGQHSPAMARLQAAAQRLWAIVERHGGAINKIDLHPTGHTLVVLFGAPVAQGRDAERAVSCALALLQDLGAHQAGAGQEPAGDVAGPLLVRRIGLASGRVFAGAVGSAARREYTVMGSVVNLAARLMDIAADGQALLDVTTAQVAERFAHLQAQPPVLMKGYDQPVPCFGMAVQRGARVSLLMRPQQPLVGRAAELAQTQQAVANALSGSGSIVALIGEAGIGKSRLLAEIVRLSLRALPTRAIAIVQAQPHSRVLPYSMIAEIFRHLYTLPDQADQAARALAAQAQQLGPDLERFLPALPTLFGLPAEASPLTQALTPDERRARVQRLAAALLVARASTAPIALLLEDLHWADSASIEILGAAILAARAVPLLLVCTYRPDRQPAWPSQAPITRVELPPLTAEHSQALIEAWMRPLTLPDRLQAAVVERTQGNPFFIEETTRALREREPAGGIQPPLPVTIQGALLARLDTLPLEERYVLQVASTIGPLFQRSLLAGVAGEQVGVERALDHLSAQGLLRPAGEDRYAFAHSLAQETVYESLLFAQRRELHFEIAQRLRSETHDDADLALLAYHYRRAEAWPETLEFAWQAGTRAQALYAGDIALTHFRQALEATDRINQVGAARRPAILRRIGDLHALAGRYADAIAAFSAALAVSDDRREQAEVLICWAEIYEEQAAYDEALARLQQALDQLERPDDPLALRIAVRRGWVLIRRGDAEEARAAVEPHIERLEVQELWGDLLLAYKVFFQIALDQGRWSEARGHLRLALIYAERTGNIREIARIQNNLGIVLIQEGNLREAKNACERAARVMEEIGDRNTLASVQVNIGGIYYNLGDFMIALEYYNASLQIATSIGALPIESIVRSNLGEIYRRLGNLEESLDQIIRSVELCRQMGDDLGLSEANRQLAETYIALDRLADAQNACARAIECALAAGDPQSEAIAYRVRGQLAATRGDFETATVDMQRSIQLLTELGSTHELGKSMAIQARVWLSDGRADLARATVEEAILLFQKAGAADDLEQAQQLLDAIYAGEIDPEVHQ